MKFCTYFFHYFSSDVMNLAHIYVINLAKREARRHRMENLAKLLGLEIEIYQAIDGSILTQEDLTKYGIKQMPGYQDPYLKRNLKLGEIACFLSHYNIWKQIVKYQYDRVLILEDDVKFTRNFKMIAEEIVEEADDTGIPYDLIYFAHRNMGNAVKKVNGTTRLVRVDYTYWTTAYVLTLDGAKKLIEAKPLQNMVPVDEFLPMMFNKHPNKEWSSKFPKRDLIAWGANPPIAEPQIYLGQKGYISDTEDSSIINIS